MSKIYETNQEGKIVIKMNVYTYTVYIPFLVLTIGLFWLNCIYSE